MKTMSFPRRRESDVSVCEKDPSPINGLGWIHNIIYNNCVAVNYLFISFWSAFAEEETPVPIPNTAVKLLVVDGTALVTAWESRTALLLIIKRPSIWWAFFFASFARGQVLIFYLRDVSRKSIPLKCLSREFTFAMSGYLWHSGRSFFFGSIEVVRANYKWNW